jgi:general secretion pathway protein L
MSEALVIRLGQDAADVQFLLVDASGGRLGAVIAGPLSQAATLAAGRRAIIVVPAVDVVTAEPELPAKNAARLAQLAPFALEEQLAAEIDKMHFAVGKRGENGKTPVAAVLRELIERWLAELAQAGIQPDALYAETSLLPITSAVTLVLDRNLLYVQSASAPGFVLDAHPLSEAVQLALAQDAADTSAAEQFVGDIQFYVAQTDYEAQHAALEQLRESAPGMQIKLLPEGALPLLALQVAQNTSLNLLCGPYERKSPLSASLAPWRYAAVLFGAAVTLQLIYGGLQLWRAVRTERQLDTQIREVAQALPGINVANTGDVRKQVEARLSTLQRSGARSDFLSSLSVLGDAMKQTTDARIEALIYRTQGIDLRVSAPTATSLDKIQQAATAGGLTAKLLSTSHRDNKFEGNLQIRP